MKIKLLATTALITVLAMGSAMAQNTTATGTGTATSGSASNSQSSSSAANQGNAQNITFNSPAQPTTTTSNINDRVSGGTNSTVTTNGDQTIRTTPTVYAPPVSGGNPCTLAVSGGVSVIGWGAAAGGTFVDQDCANRQKIAMIHNAGYPGAAKELMCNDRGTYDAFKTAGQPCAVRPAWEPQGAPPPAPMVQMAPGPVVAPPPPPPPMARKSYPRCDARRGIVDNCQS